MSDNPQYGDASFFALPALRVVALEGRDAVAFAQAQFMNDVAALADGQWQWNGWLDPKGRVLALFALLRADADVLWLVTCGDAEKLAANLARYVFRSKVTIGLAGVAASGRFAAPASARRSMSAAVDGGVELDLSGDAGERTLLLARDAPTRSSASAEPAARWWSLDIAHGWPALPGIALDHWTPQQLSLQRLNAFSVKKGCYPGQEIVARTHFLGRAKRGLARLRADASSRPGDPLLGADDREVGQLVAVHGGEALAVVPLDVADDTLRLHGEAVVRLPLADGMER